MEDTKTFAPTEAKLHFLDYWRVIRIRKAIIITVFLITSIIATAVTFVLPESYSSMARVKVENDITDIPSMGSSSTYVPYDPYFIQTTFEIMQSELVLSNVIARLNLNTKWGQKYYNNETLKTTETMEILKQRMALAPVKNLTDAATNLQGTYPDILTKVAVFADTDRIPNDGVQYIKTFPANLQAITTEGLLETAVSIGDRYRIGSAVVMVTTPRLPCFKLAAKFQRDDIIERFVRSGRCGFYFSVVEEGEVGADDEFELLGREEPTLTIAEVNRLYTAKSPDRECLQRSLHVKTLPESWRDRFRARIADIDNLSHRPPET